MKLLFLSSFLFTAFLAHAQFSVRGVVIDRETQTPLPGASAFLSNTTKGVSTNANGEFVITNLKALQYQLVISFVGYKTEIFDVVPGQPVYYKVMLSPSSELLQEVVVRSKKMTKREFQAALKTFTDHFIGHSENAPQCDILNPEALLFDKEGSVLLAFTDSTLVIDNHGLGYRIKVSLQDYRYDFNTTQLFYVGPMSFEYLLPESENEKLLWAKNRLKAYHGSQMHFFRSLYNQRLNEEGFYFIFPGSPSSDDSVKIVKSKVFKNELRLPTIVNYTQLIDSDTLKPNVVLRFKNALQVVYVNETEPKLYQINSRKLVKKTLQSSMISMMSPAIIQPDGQPVPVNAVQFSGYWGWELMAETLPLDYEPEEDMKLTGLHYP